MSLKHVLCSTVAAIGISAFAAGAATPANAQAKRPAPAAVAAVAIDADDIGGIVRGPSGPEAGVWVIAETTDLPTRYTKSVVTDDQGRYVIPDLPNAQLSGLGARLRPRRLAARCAPSPARSLNLTAVNAPDAASAAHYYPAIYWYTMMKIPPAKDFGGHTDIPKEHHARDLDPADEQHRLRRLSSARPGVDAHRSRRSSASSTPARTPGFAASPPASPAR